MFKKYILILGLFSVLFSNIFAAQDAQEVSYSRLYDACLQGNLKRVRRLVVLGTDVNVGKVETFADQIVYTSPLYEAIKMATLNPHNEELREIVVLLLIDGKADPSKGKYNNRDSRYFLESSLCIPPSCALFENWDAMINFNKNDFKSLNELLTLMVINGIDINACCIVSNDNYRDENFEIAFNYIGLASSSSFTNLCIDNGNDLLLDKAFKLGADKNRYEMVQDLDGTLSIIPPILKGYQQVDEMQYLSNDGGVWSFDDMLWPEAMKKVIKFQRRDHEKVSEEFKEFSKPLIDWPIERLTTYLDIYYKTYNAYKVLGVLLNHGMVLNDTCRVGPICERALREIIANKDTYKAIREQVYLFEKMHDVLRLKENLAKEKRSLPRFIFDTQRGIKERPFRCPTVAMEVEEDGSEAMVTVE